MKALGVLVMMALVVGAFTSIPNVSAISPNQFGDLTLYKGAGNSQPKFGSASGVCGVELCSSKSMPAMVMKNSTTTVTINNDAKSEALKRALEGSEASMIISEYSKYKGITTNIEITNSTEDIVKSKFNAFANSDFLDSDYKVKSTLMKNPDTMTTEEKKKEQVEKAKANFPNYIKNSYANTEHPVYIPKVNPMMIENVTSTEMIEKPLMKNMTGFEADLILFNMGFDIDMTKIGACGPGTELINGICFIKDEYVDMTKLIDAAQVAADNWSGTWDTKEDKEIVLEQVIMTNGEEAIPVVDDNMVIEEEQVIEEPIETPITIPSFEESTIGMNSTNVVIEEVQVPEPIPEPVVEEIVEPIDTSVTVDGKTFKDQASADRFMALKGTPEPVVEEVIPEPMEEVPVDPRENENEQTQSIEEAFNPRLNNQP